MSLAFDYMVIADALTGSAVRLRFGRTFCTSVHGSHANDGQCNIRKLRFPNPRHDIIIIDDPQREGFDIEKLGELEKDLGELITKRLNLAIKKGEVVR